MDEPAAARRRSLGQVALLAQDDAQPAPGGVPGDAGAIDAAADHQQVRLQRRHDAANRGVRHRSMCYRRLRWTHARIIARRPCARQGAGAGGVAPADFASACAAGPETGDSWARIRTVPDQ